MAGGLIQIVTYGSQDLYLTGTPEITFFLVVYRRHTNFAMESVSVNFDNTVGFGSTSVVTIPKIGDLMHKTYLQIVLPQIQFQRLLSSIQLTDGEIEYTNALNNYETVTNFMSVNSQAFVSAFDIENAANWTGNNAVATMTSNINAIFNSILNQPAVIAFQNLYAAGALPAGEVPPYIYNEVSMQAIANANSSLIDKNVFYDMLVVGIDKSIKLQNYFRLYLLETQNIYFDNINPYLKFAWVDKVGYALIEEIDVKIGGYKIDKQYKNLQNS